MLNVVRGALAACGDRVQRTRLQLRHPTLSIQGPSVWRFDTLDAIELGRDVVVASFTEIVAFARSPRSRVPGKLTLGDGVYLAAGCNIRAAGGSIAIGAGSLVGQHTVIVASNHRFERAATLAAVGWDEGRTGVAIGARCWIGANCVILPGVTIGDGAVVAAGSVVTRSIPADEVWAGTPARFLKAVPSAA